MNLVFIITTHWQKYNQWNDVSIHRYARKKFMVQTSAGAVMVSVFWDSERITFVEFLERGATTNSERDVQTLKKLKQRTGMVGPNRKIDQVLLLVHDNTRPHTNPRTRKAITTIGWTVLPHPPYSPDLAPSDYHIFGLMKDALGGQPLADNGELKHSAREEFRCFSLILHRRTASNAKVEKSF
jgi:histone-lysine N-methyltransferase SETMAR